MAASLAAAIKSGLDATATLVEGHDGIYEVSVENEIVYTNNSSCSQGFPSNELVVGKVGEAIGVTPAGESPSGLQADTAEGAACPIPKMSSLKPVPTLQVLGCGCGPAPSTPSDGSGCCPPAGGGLAGGGDSGKSGGCC